MLWYAARLYQSDTLTLVFNFYIKWHPDFSIGLWQSCIYLHLSLVWSHDREIGLIWINHTGKNDWVNQFSRKATSGWIGFLCHRTGFDGALEHSDIVQYFRWGTCFGTKNRTIWQLMEFMTPVIKPISDSIDSVEISMSYLTCFQHVI